MVFRLSLSDVLEFYEYSEICMETCVYFYDFQHPPYRTTVLIRDHGAYNLSAKSYEIYLIYARKLEKGETGRTAPVQIGGRRIQPCSREFRRQMVQPWRRCGEGLLVAVSCLTLAERRSTNGTSVLVKASAERIRCHTTILSNFSVSSKV